VNIAAELHALGALIAPLPPPGYRLESSWVDVAKKLREGADPERIAVLDVRWRPDPAPLRGGPVWCFGEIVVTSADLEMYPDPIARRKFLAAKVAVVCASLHEQYRKARAA
jgi:hypothetical protein